MAPIDDPYFLDCGFWWVPLRRWVLSFLSSWSSRRGCWWRRELEDRASGLAPVGLGREHWACRELSSNQVLVQFFFECLDNLSCFLNMGESVEEPRPTPMREVRTWKQRHSNIICCFPSCSFHHCPRCVCCFAFWSNLSGWSWEVGRGMMWN